MYINLTLNDEQTELIKQSLFSVLSTKEIAGQLFTKLSLEKHNTFEAQKLRTALIEFFNSEDLLVK